MKRRRQGGIGRLSYAGMALLPPTFDEALEALYLRATAPGDQECWAMIGELARKARGAKPAKKKPRQRKHRLATTTTIPQTIIAAGAFPGQFRVTRPRPGVIRFAADVSLAASGAQQSARDREAIAAALQRLGR